MMINTALDLVRRQLDAFLRKADPRAEGWVILSNLVDPDGRPFAATKGKIVMALANIIHAASTRNQPIAAAGHAVAPPPIEAELLVLFFANFHGQHYAEGLTAIARTIDYFHRMPVFSHANAPDLDPTIDRLTMTPTNLDLPALSSLMGMHGAGYLPSVCYTLRLIPLATGATPALEPRRA